MNSHTKIIFGVISLTLVGLVSGCGKVSINTNPPLQPVHMEQTEMQPTTTAPATSTPQEKIEVTSENWFKQDKDFAKLVASGQDPHLNADRATSTVHYINFEHGFKVDIPYNKSWGTKKIYPAPFELFNPESGASQQYVIKFGPLVVTGEGEIGLERPYYISVSKHRDIDQIESDFKKEISGYDLGSDKWPPGEKLIINGLPVFHGMHSILCEHHEYEIVGKNYNVVVSSACDDTEEAGKVLLDVIKSMKFFDPNKRIVLTPENIEKLNLDQMTICELNFNQDPPNTTVTYTDKKAGFSVEIPYNKLWGDQNYSVPPYSIEKNGRSITFGDMTTHGEGCGFIQYHSIFISEHQLAPAVEAAARNLIAIEYPGNTYLLNSPELQPTILHINNLEVVRYSDPPGMCANIHYEIIGKKYNYDIINQCGDDGGLENNPMVKQVLQSFKLIN